MSKKQSTLLDNILKIFKAKGIEPTAEEVTTIAGELMTNEEIEVKKPSNIDYGDISHNKEIVRALENKIDALTTAMENQNKEHSNQINNLLKGFEEEKIAREQSLTDYKSKLEEKEKTEKQTLINALIEKGITENKLAPKNEKLIADLKKIAETDIEVAKTILESYPSIATASNTIETNGNSDQNKYGFSSEMQTLTSGISPAILDRVTQ